MKACDFIVSYLARHVGLTHVFTYAGGTHAPLLNAVHQARLPFVAMRHEQNAAFAAEGYARVSGRVGVAIAMSGPGATNLLTGVANAFFDSSRVLYVTGQVVSKSYKFNRPIRQLGYQETDIVSMARPVTKYARLVARADEVASELRRALSEVEGGRPGPALFDVPFDVQNQDVAESELQEAVALPEAPALRDDDLRAVEEEIRAASRPIIIAGGGVAVADVRAGLRALAEKYELPVVVSILGKDAFPNDHPLYAGFLGAYGNRPANIAVTNADLVLALGSRLDSRQTGSLSTFARGARKVHVDIDRNELHATVKSDVAIHADLGQVLERLVARPGVACPPRAPWRAYLAELAAAFPRDWVAVERLVDPIPFFHALSAAAPEDSVFACDVGNNLIWAAKGLQVRHGQRFLCSGGLGSMGFALPAAIGARCAAARPTFAIAGDGGFQMSLPELATVAHHRFPIKMIVLNNGVLGLVKNFQEENYQSAYPATVWGYSCPDLEKIAQAYGIGARTIRADADVPGALEELCRAEGPALLNVLVDPEHKPYPKVRPGAALDQQDPPVDEELLRRFTIVPR